VILNDARCTLEMKSSITMAKAAFNKKKNVLTRKLNLNIRKKEVICYIWCTEVHSAENLKLRKLV